MLSGQKIYRMGMAEGLKPDPTLTVSQWSDKYRVLSQRTSSEPGRWRTDRTPYLKEIMDVLSSASKIKEVVFMKGAQVGGTEAGNNWIGYMIDCAPGPTLYVMPTVEMAKKNSKNRVDPLIDECKQLRAKVKAPKSKDSGNTILTKIFPGGILNITGANSSVGLRSMPVKYLFLDEIDTYPLDVDDEGEPVKLAEARTRTFPRKKIFKVSTPTIEGTSRIKDAYLKSDQRRFYVPCPFCELYQVLEWKQLTWPKGEPGKAVYTCIGCQAEINEGYKTTMMSAGAWRAENEAEIGGTVAGFHLSSLYSPAGWYAWAEAAEDWERSHKNPNKLRVFINTILGETWKEKGDAPDWKRLYNRRSKYKIGTIPEGGLLVTAGVDVQKETIHVEIVAWGRDMVSYSVDYLIIEGDTSTPSPWQELDKIIARPIPHENKRNGYFNIKKIAIDSGFRTQTVYNYVRKKPFHQVMAIKGSENQSQVIGSPKPIDVRKDGKRIKARGVRLWSVGVNIIKSEIYGNLQIEQPIGPDPIPPGFCFFPEYSEIFFQELTAEHLIAKMVRGYRRYIWEKIRERNEALDCRVYARAAAAALGVDRFKKGDWDKLDIAGGGGGSEGGAKKRRKVERKKSDFW